MKVLLYGHRLELGGSQTNAIELAALLRERHGHHTVLYATPGPAATLAAQRAVRVVPAPSARFRPSPTMVSALRRVVREEQPDLVHAWDWPQVLEAVVGCAGATRVPLLATSMTQVVERAFPRSVPTTFGIADLVEQARRSWRAPVDLLVPPVDTDHNRPGVVAARPFLEQHGLELGPARVVIVSRLTGWLKLDSLRRSMAAVDRIAAARDVQLVVVGTGDAEAQVARLAAQVNERHGRRVVALLGALVDPRPAYESADVMVSMGGSALRSLAFGKPTVVVGEDGFGEVFEPSSRALFDRQGFYGIGDGDPSVDRLVAQLECLLDDAELRSRLGAFGRSVAVERYSLPIVGAELDRIYRVAVEHACAPPLRAVDTARSVGARLAAIGTQRLPGR